MVLVVRQTAVDEVVVVLGELTREVAHFEVPWTGLADETHLDRAAGDEHLLEALQLLRPDRALDNLDAALAGEVHQGLAGDAVEEAIGCRRMQLAVAHEEDVGAGP